MLYLADTADVSQITRLCDLYPLDGVTTNPTIVAREKADFFALLHAIRKAIGPEAMLHVQALGQTAEQMIAEAHHIMAQLGERVWIKIPVTSQGIKAIKQLNQDGIKTTATAIFTPQQALMAAKAGADFVAPYVNRLDNICADGCGVVAEIAQLIALHQLPSRILAASFKNVEQVHKASLCGAHAITAAPDIIDGLLQHPLTTHSVRQFTADWETVYGSGTLTTDL